MYELNGKEITLEFLQGKAQEYNMDFDSYLETMKQKGLVEKTQGVAATDAAVTSQPDMDLASENTSLESSEDESFFDKAAEKFRQYMPSFGLSPVQKLKKQQEQLVRDAKESQRTNTDDYVKDKQNYINFLKNEFLTDDKYNYAAIDLRQEIGDVRKELLNELEVGGFFSVGNRSRFMSLNDDDLRNLFNDEFNTKVFEQKSKIEKEKIQEGTQNILDSGGSLDKEYSASEDNDIMSFKNKLERDLASVNKKLRDESIGDEEKNNFIEQQKVIVEKLKAPKKIINRQGQIIEVPGDEFSFFYNPITGEGSSIEIDDSQNLSDQVEAEITTISTTTQDKLEDYYNNNFLERVGHKSKGNKTYDITVGNKSFSTILNNAGYKAEKGVFKNVPVSEMARFAHLFDDSPDIFMAKNNINISPQDANKSDFESAQDFADYLRVYQDEGRDLAIKHQAIKQVYLLNKDVTSIKKKPLQRHFEAASEGIIGPRATESNFGYSNRKILDQIEEITTDTDIPLNDKQKEYLERSIGDEINEGFGGAYGILGTLLLANKVQGTVLGVTKLGRLMTTLNAPRYVKKGRVVSQSTMIKRAAKTGKSLDDITAGFTKVGPSRLNQFNGLLLTGAMEEVKMQSVGFDPGVGAGFMLGAKALPFKWTTKYNQLNTLLNLSTKQAPAFVLGTNFGEITKGAIDDIAGEDVYSAFLEEHYGDLDKLGRKAIVDLALGAAFGATHLKRMDLKRTESIAKLKNDAMFKMIEAHTKGDDVTLAKYQEIYSAAKNRLDAMDKIDLYTNPATAQKAYQKQLDPVVKAFKAKGKDLIIETTTEELADGRNAEYIPMQGGNPGKIKININKAKPGLMPHEVIHASFDLLFEGNPTLRGKYLNQLKNITKEIKLEDGRSLYEAILAEKSIKDVNKVEEMFAYTTEYLSRAEHYTSLVAGNAFGKLKQNILGFAERNGLGKPALKTQQDLVNFLGRYVETIQKGYNPIKQLERLNEIIEITEARKEGEKASFGSIDLKAKKAKIIEQNKKLVAEKPEGYLELAKKNNEALKKINENLRISEANEKNIKIFKEREPGDPTRVRAENELLKDNAPTIETWFRSNFKKGLDVSEADFRSSMNEQVARIMKSYNNFDVPFGYYLKSRLAPQLGNILKRAQAGRTTEVAMSEMGKDFDIETLADVTPTMSAEGVGTHSAKGRRLVEDLSVPKEVVNKITEQVKELDVEKLTYKTLKDLAPEFTNELLGVEPKAGNISRGSVENAQRWFSDDANARLFLDILPEGTIPMEGAPELVKGTATGVQNVLLKGFYAKGARAKTKQGVAIQEKIKTKNTQDVKEFFGIKPDGTFEYNRNLSSKVKAAVEQIGKAITNQVVREAAKNDVILGENIGKENLLNQIQAGKSEALASIDLLYKENKMQVSTTKIAQDVGRFIRDEAEFKKSNPKEHGIIKDFIELQTKYEAEIGRENEVKFTKEAKKLPFEWAKDGSWQVSTSKFKKDIKLVEEFKDNAFDLADIIPLSENMTLGNAKMLVDLFTGHYSVIRGIKQYDKVNSPFKLGIRERLVNDKKSPLSQELQQRWKEFSWDKLKSSYASQFYTGLKKVYEQNTLEAQKAEVRKFVNSENGKLQVELYDLWNSTLQEWVSMSKKGSKEYNNKMNFIARMKKHNSSIGTTGERVLAPSGYYYLPGKVVQGTLKYEHLKSSSEQSFESLALIANGAWTTRGKESLKKYQGIWGMLKDFNTIDRQTGETNSAGIHRLAESLELAKNIYSVKSDFKRNLYQDIVLEVGQKEVNRIIKSDKAITKQSVNKLKNIGLGYSGMSGVMASKNLKIHDKAVELGRQRNKKSRGMSTFDFDETLIDKGNNFIVAKKGKETIRISSGQWPLQGPKLAEAGYKFDFSDFVNVRGGVEGPLFKKFKERLTKFGPENMYILTARPAEAATAIHGWLKSKGVEIPLKNITGLGNSTGEAKALWMLEKFSEGYNDMYFVDDALPNVKAVKEVLRQLDIKSDVQQALASIDLNKGVNDIMEHSLDIQSQKRFSKAEGEIRGKKAQRRRLFIPDSAADFELLLEPLYGKGKKGIENKKWFQDNIVRQFERGMNDYNKTRQAVTTDYMNLRKNNKDVVKLLDKEVPGMSFTNDMAMRVYIWNKAGYTIPDLAASSQKALVKHVVNNPKLQAYAESLSKLTKIEGGLKEPGANWWGETIATEISDVGRGSSRAEFLRDFIERKNEIFSEENLNKMQSKLGSKWRSSIEDMLNRMETGRTRAENLSGPTRALMNYLNGSVAAIMNLNTRSATLQLISTVNFINSSFNNPLQAAKALANTKQYAKDFMFIMNSDMLKQRRQGLEINVTEAEIASAADSKNPAKAIIAKILKAGYIPTKFADSFAIASGGATFYRNAIKKYMKEGMTEAEASKKAFVDFQAIAERTQQSSRADLISKQQTTLAGRFILPFANTPMQMNRIMVKNYLDIYKGRYEGFYGENSLTEKLGNIGYYGFIQSAIFAGLQSGAAAVFSNSDDDELKAKKKTQMLDGISTSFLRGMGIQGAVLDGVIKAGQEFHKQREKGRRADYSEIGEKLLNISPPIGSKISKLDAAGDTYDYNRKVIETKPFQFGIEDPALRATALTVEATTNYPLNRHISKLQNIQNALDNDYSAMERFLSLMGWSIWGVNPKKAREKQLDFSSVGGRTGKSKIKSKKR